MCQYSYAVNTDWDTTSFTLNRKYKFKWHVLNESIFSFENNFLMLKYENLFSLPSQSPIPAVSPSSLFLFLPLSFFLPPFTTTAPHKHTPPGGFVKLENSTISRHLKSFCKNGHSGYGWFHKIVVCWKEIHP